MLKKLPSLFFFIGIAILLINIVSLITGHQGFALNFAQLAFFLLTLGTIFYILELKRNEKR